MAEAEREHASDHQRVVVYGRQHPPSIPPGSPRTTGHDRDLAVLPP
jgi:hypothetical protein